MKFFLPVFSAFFMFIAFSVFPDDFPSYNFEDDIANWTVEGKGSSIIIPDSDDVLANGGPASGVAAKVAVPAGISGFARSPFIKVSPAFPYEVSASLNLNGPASRGLLRLRCFDGEKKKLKDIDVARISETGKWIDVRKKLELPRNSRYVRLQILPSAVPGKNGSCLFGSVRLVPLVSRKLDIVKKPVLKKPDSRRTEQTPLLADDKVKAVFRLETPRFSRWQYFSDAELDAEVSISDEVSLFGKGSLKVNFLPLKSRNEKTCITLQPEAPLKLGAFDTISMWVLGEFLCPLKRTVYNISPFIVFNFKDGKGRSISFESKKMEWNAWSPVRIHLDRVYDDLSLESISIRNLHDQKGLGNKKVCFYADNIKFYEKKYPGDYKIPEFEGFSSADIAPGANVKLKNLRLEKDASVFTYNFSAGNDVYKIKYRPETGTMSDFTVSVNDCREFVFAPRSGFRFQHDGRKLLSSDSNVKVELEDIRLTDDKKIKASWLFKVDGKRGFALNCIFSVVGNSLIAGLSSPDNYIESFIAGRPAVSGAEPVAIPYLSYKMGGANVYCWKKNRDIYTSQIWDWAGGRASRYEPEDAVYHPKTDHSLNTFKENIIYSFSSVIDNVFPNIPNPPTPFKAFLKDHILYKVSMPDFRNQLYLAELCRAYGMENLIFGFHVAVFNRSGARGGGRPMCQTSEVHPYWGGDERLKEYSGKIHKMGYKLNLFDDYVVSAPLSKYFNENDMAIGSDNRDIWGWFGLPVLSPVVVGSIAPANAAELKKKYSIDSMYSDQYTAQQFYNRNDYDHRKPGSGMASTTFRCYASTIMKQKKAVGGPIISEGGYQWFLSGILDCNYGSLRVPGIRWQYPLIVNFKLEKMHQLEATLSMGPGGLTFQMKNEDFAYPEYRGLDRLIAYSMAYGNAAVFYFPYIPNLGHNDTFLDIRCNRNWRGVLRYYYLCKYVQKNMLFEKIRDIRYWINGKFMTLSKAVPLGIGKLRKVRVRYRNGLEVFANGALKENDTWRINAPDGKKLVLPAPGFAIFLKGKLISASFLNKGQRLDYAESPDYIYFDPRGSLEEFRGVKGNAQTIILKRPDYYKVIVRDGGICELSEPLLSWRKIDGVSSLDAEGKELPFEERNITKDNASILLKPVFAYKLYLKNRAGKSDENKGEQ